MRSLVVEGWRRSSHSYALVNQHQLLHLITDRRFAVSHVDMPFFRPHWAQVDAGFPAATRSTLEGLAAPAENPADLTYRISWPLRVYAGASRATFVFGTCELGRFDPGAFVGPTGTEQGVDFNAVELVTPSYWSRAGFVGLGFKEECVHVISHGVDPALFAPANTKGRAQVRSALGISEDALVFLNIGAVTWNKGIGPLLAAFARYRQRHQQAILVLKGGDSLYGNLLGAALEEARRLNPDVASSQLKAALRYVPQNLSQQQLSMLYRASDVYISPYRAEGFNLPALEARAAGLPVIVTSGGATDDFCDGDSCLKIAAQLTAGSYCRHLEPQVESIVDCLERMTDGLSARRDAARRQAPRILEKYSWRSVTRQLADLLSQDPVAPTRQNV